MAVSFYPSAVLLGLLALTISPAIAVDTSTCTCYQTSTDDFFTSYKFYDFRSVGLPSGVPTLESTLPDSADDDTGVSADDVGVLQGGFIQSQEWMSSWGIQDWGKGQNKDTSYRMWNSLSNVYFDKNTDGNANASTKLVMRTKRFAGFQSTAEVENQEKNLLYASTRIRARVTGDAGAVAGLFYYRNSANESDIEILTRDDPTEIRYSNQPVVNEGGDEIKDSSTKVDITTHDLVDGTELTDKRSVAEIKWTDWHTHRIDWVAGKSSWYIDGVHQLDKTYGVPTVPSYVVFNMWSDGGVWSGNMSVNCQALLEIEWVEMVFNVSGPVDSSDYDSNSRKPKVRRQNTGCITPCSVDENGESRILTGGYTTTSAGTRNSTMWTGTSDREFVIATAMGAAVAVVLYMIDMSTM